MLRLRRGAAASLTVLAASLTVLAASLTVLAASLTVLAASLTVLAASLMVLADVSEEGRCVANPFVGDRTAFRTAREA